MIYSDFRGADNELAIRTLKKASRFFGNHADSNGRLFFGKKLNSSSLPCTWRSVVGTDASCLAPRSDYGCRKRDNATFRPYPHAVQMRFKKQSIFLSACCKQTKLFWPGFMQTLKNKYRLTLTRCKCMLISKKNNIKLIQ